MTVSKSVKGTILLTGSYQMIYPELEDDTLRDPRWVEGWIFLHELTAGDQVHIRFSTYDDSGQLLRVYDEPVISGIQEPISAFHIGAVLTPWFRVEIVQTLAPGSYKNVNFLFYEVT